jgi:hypothetical protein
LHENEKIARLKTIAADWHIPESSDIQRSRLVLQQYCYERFGAGNEKVARELDWPIDQLVPPVDVPGFSYDGLQELDTLWSTSMSKAEQELFFLALEGLLACDARATDDRSDALDGRSTNPNTGDRGVTGPDHKATAKRAAIAESWMTELSTGSTDTDSPFLARRSDGSVFLIEGGTKRPVRSGLLAAALEDCLGPSRAVTDGDLEAKSDGVPVELFEDPGGEPFVVFAGEHHRARGVPLTYPVSERAASDLRRGKEIDLARANVPRRRLREVMAVSYQLQRLKSAAKRKGIVGTAKEVTRRAGKAVTKRTDR